MNTKGERYTVGRSKGERNGAEAAETVEVDGVEQIVSTFALVQFRGRDLAELLVVDPIEDEEGALDPPHLIVRRIDLKHEIPIKSFAVSLFILRPREDTFDLLLLRRAGTILTGEWCQVAGGIQHGETAWQASLREAKEETGLTLTTLYSADICEQFYEADRDAITLTPVFVAYAPSDSVVQLNDEHNDFRWLPLDEAAALLPFAGQRATLEHIKKEFVDRRPNPLLRIQA